MTAEPRAVELLVLGPILSEEYVTEVMADVLQEKTAAVEVTVDGVVTCSVI